MYVLKKCSLEQMEADEPQLTCYISDAKGIFACLDCWIIILAYNNKHTFPCKRCSMSVQSRPTKSLKQFMVSISAGSTDAAGIWTYHFAFAGVPAADLCLMKDFKSTLVIVGISKPLVRDEKIK